MSVSLGSGATAVRRHCASLLVPLDCYCSCSDLCFISFSIYEISVITNQVRYFFSASQRAEMTKIVGQLTLLGFWMLVAGLGEGSSSPNNMFKLSDRQPFSKPCNEADGQASRTYIVYMDKSPSHGSNVGTLDETSAWSSYTQLLQSVKQDSTTQDSVQDQPHHVYTSVCNGFSATLSPQEAARMRGMDGVLGVVCDTKLSLQTTHTPQYLGLNTMNGLWPEGHFGDDTIIGVLDTGFMPGRASFNDAGLGPVPTRWKGICQTGQDFQESDCNRKVIGARFFGKGYEQYLLNSTGKPLKESLESRSSRDAVGHGSHTASTAAGSAAPNAGLYGAADGIASGVAPKARLAIYKVCWSDGCMNSDILAGFDQAVIDGVDIISISLSSSDITPYFKDHIAIGAFGAMKKGIFVSCSAGNQGPDLETVHNYAPWMMTVAASTVDRSFPANVRLGNGQIVPGQSFNHLRNIRRLAKLITGAAAAVNNVTSASLCMSGSLDPALVNGKIVTCLRGSNEPAEKSLAVSTAGGAGMILFNNPADGEGVYPEAHFLPASHVGAKAASIILAYINSTRNPVAKFRFKAAQYDVKPAPAMAHFSSRGPNPLSPQVLKPDITGPGVFILAAWTDRVGLTGLPFDNRQVDFNIISGTSMSCPHISGVGALLKAARPEWSPAAIKSAMMTTATIFDNTGGIITDQNEAGLADPIANAPPANPFLFGAGHVRPEKAMNPGLIYDLSPEDYVNFLCALNYSRKEIQIINGGSGDFRCPNETIRLEDMNYPSFAAVFQQLPSEEPITMNLTRTLTNVGGKAHGCSTYKAKILQTPVNVTISVHPNVLRFCKTNQKEKFTLQVTTINTPNPALSGFVNTHFAFLQWSDGRHIVVQSPIGVTVVK